MRALKRVIAFVGSAAAAIGLAASAMTAFAFEPVDLDDRASDLKNGVANIIADEVYAEPGETVSYRVMIKYNSGYGPSGIALTYDSALTPVKEADGIKPALKWGDGAYGLTQTCSLNEEKHLVAIGTTGTQNCTKDGVIYTAKFVVPADAKENTVYPMTLRIDKFLNAKTNVVENNPVNGWIRIRKPSKETTVSTTSATISTTTTTLTTVTTVSTSKSSVTTEPTTSKSVTNPTTVSSTVSTVTKIETEVSTVSNTSKTDRQDPNKSEPTTASRQNGVTATTKKAATTSSTTTATKTGDAGVGVAAAALLLSGTVAAVCKRKKEH